MITRSHRAAAVAAALLVSLPAVAVADQEVPAHAAPHSPAVEAALLPRAPLVLTAGPVLQQPAHLAAAPAVRAAVGNAPDRRESVPASRSMTRKAKPRAHARRVHTIAKRAEVRHARPVKRTVVRHASRPARKRAVTRGNVQRHATAPRGLSAVAAYARRQVGKPYIYNAAGPYGYDCSGLVLAAYRQIGVRLPHQSGAQAARAYPVSRSQAVPGDLVVGSGHVGVYMGAGMMVDAPGRNRSILYRRMFSGLHIERVR